MLFNILVETSYFLYLIIFEKVRETMFFEFIFTPLIKGQESSEFLIREVKKVCHEKSQKFKKLEKFQKIRKILKTPKKIQKF